MTGSPRQFTEPPAWPLDAVSAAPPATRIGGRTFEWRTRTFVMGIVNVTPDSFSGDGLLGGAGPTAVVEAALEQARRMLEAGADLLDVGGESTRPGHATVDAAEEARRVVPVIAALHERFPDTPISVDTTKRAVASAALDAGASLLNDIWGVGEESLAPLAGERGVSIVLMHNRAEAGYHDVVREVVDDLARATDRALAAGVAPTDVIVDPGIGFGKTAEHNLAVLRGLAMLRVLGRPILLGTSRKSTLGRVLDLPPEERVEATVATTVLGVAAGADIVRVHDVLENVRAGRMADAILRGWPAPARGDR